MLFSCSVLVVVKILLLIRSKNVKLSGFLRCCSEVHLQRRHALRFSPQVSIIAGRPMHCQVPGIDYSLSKLAIHAALESATAIALSHTGILYIAETDEKKINRVRQVRGGALDPLPGLESTKFI